jgi:hypothetical protein
LVVSPDPGANNLTVSWHGIIGCWRKSLRLARSLPVSFVSPRCA